MSYNVETGMYEGYIYLILNDIDANQIYVGQTIRSVDIRWKEHLRKAEDVSDLTKLYCKMRYYGISHFNIKVIEKHEALLKTSLLDILDEREKYYIDLFDSYENGLNSTFGGREQVSINYKEVYQYDIYGNFIRKFNSIQEASIYNNVSESNIVACCKGIHKYCANSVFRYEYLEQEIVSKTIECIWQIDKNGNIIAKYFSCLSAGNNTGINVSNISKCCLGKRKTAGGFIWYHYIPGI